MECQGSYIHAGLVCVWDTRQEQTMVCPRWSNVRSDNGDGGGSQIPPYMKDPWVIAFGIGGALLISMLALRMREESIPDNFVSWKELKTEYLDAGLVCILMYT